MCLQLGDRVNSFEKFSVGISRYSRDFPNQTENYRVKYERKIKNAAVGGCYDRQEQGDYTKPTKY